MIDWQGKERFVDLHDRIAAAGVMVYQDSAGWHCSDPLLAQLIIDAYTLDDAKRWCRSKITEYAKVLLDRVIAIYSPGEMAGWPIKLAEARAYAQSGDPAVAPMLSSEAAVRGIALDEIVTKVFGNSARLAGIEVNISGVSGRHRDAISSFSTIDEVAGYDYLQGWPEV